MPPTIINIPWSKFLQKATTTPWRLPATVAKKVIPFPKSSTNTPQGITTAQGSKDTHFQYLDPGRQEMVFLPVGAQHSNTTFNNH
jgi:hypothetical protein